MWPKRNPRRRSYVRIPKRPRLRPRVMMTGADLKFMREVNKMSRYQFARELGLSESGLWRLEAGQRRITPRFERHIKLYFAFRELYGMYEELLSEMEKMTRTRDRERR